MTTVEEYQKRLDDCKKKYDEGRKSYEGLSLDITNSSNGKYLYNKLAEQEKQMRVYQETIDRLKNM